MSDWKVNMRISLPTNDSGRRRSAEKGVLYFLHIPKTAGSSVTKWLTNRVAQGSICPAKNWDQLVMIDPQALPKLCVQPNFGEVEFWQYKRCEWLHF